jgi:uncharacterized repeat protein (TIGR01451 family)
MLKINKNLIYFINEVRNKRVIIIILIILSLILSIFTALIFQKFNSTTAAGAPITGTLFTDFNRDGKLDLSENVKSTDPFYPQGGITVTAYDETGKSVKGIVTSGVNGVTYSIDVSTLTGTKFRLEYGLTDSDKTLGWSETFLGTDSKSAVTFVNSGAVQNFGVIPPSKCPISATGADANANSATGKLWATCFINGDRSGGNGPQNVLHSLNYDNTGKIEQLADKNQLGSVWGLAYDEWRSNLFTSAYLKRHTELGPEGMDGLYWMTYPNETVKSVSLETLGGPTFGTIGVRDVDTTIFFNTTKDPSAFPLVDKTGIGDIDISKDGKTLFVTNIHSKAIMAYDVSDAQNGTIKYLGHYSLTNTDASCPNKSGNNNPSDWYPFALEPVDGDSLYVGITCNAQTSQNSADLTAKILELKLIPSGTNGNTVPVSSKLVHTIPLDYPKDCPFGGACVPASKGNFQPWQDDYTKFYNLAGLRINHPQPVFSDINISPDGSLSLNIMDRTGDQWGDVNHSPDGQLVNVNSGGDLIKICNTSNDPNNPIYLTEGVTGCKGTKTGLAPNSSTTEYYADEYGTIHPETTVGGAWTHPYLNEIVSAQYDPVTGGNVWSGGLGWMNTQTGTEFLSKELFYGPANYGLSGKANGIGDVEGCVLPVVLGDYVWLDSDMDGIQDPNEQPLAGATVTITGPGLPAAGVVVKTGPDGRYEFDSSDGLKPGVAYTIKVDPSTSTNLPTGILSSDLTSTVTGSGTNNQIDSNINSTYTMTTLPLVNGQVNHSYDAGFKPPLKAVDDIKTTPFNTPITYSPLSNDSVPPDSKITSIDGKPVTIGVPIKVPNGTVVVNNDGTITVTPDPGFTGDIKFPYTVTTPTGATVTANDTITVQGIGKIELLKTSTIIDSNNNGFSDVGDKIRYSFTVKNTGTLVLTNAIINDSKCSPITGSPIATLAVGAIVTTPFCEYPITQLDINNGKVDNTATVDASDPSGKKVSDISDDPNNLTNVDPNGDGNPDDPTVTPLAQKGQIELDKTGTYQDTNNDGVTQPGETIKYTFTVKNTGNVPLTNVKVTDTVCTNVLGGPIPTLAVGAVDTTTFTCIYIVTPTDIVAGKVTNTATATGTDPKGNQVQDQSNDPKTTTPNDPTVTPLVQKGQIELDKAGTLVDTNNDGSSQVGETIKYTFTVKNTGNVPLTNVKVTDTVCTNVLGGPIPTLAVGATDTTTFTCTYTLTQTDINNGQVTNTATATGTDPKGNQVQDQSNDPKTTTPNDPTVTPLAQKGQIELDKTGTYQDTNNDGVTQPGETIKYTFTVKNTGNVPLTNVKVTDTVCTNVLGGPIPTLAVGAVDTTTFTCIYIVTPTDIVAGKVTNTATATGTDPKGNQVQDQSNDPKTTTPNDPTVTPLVQKGQIELDKAGTLVDTNNDGSSQVGETIKYTFTVKNTGNVPLTNIVISDNKCTPVLGGPIATLAINAVDSTTFTCTYNLKSEDILAGKVDNQAVVSGKDPNNNIVTDLSNDPKTVTPNDITSTPLKGSAVDDFKETPINTPVTYNPLANDIVPTGSKITSINGQPITPGQTINVPNGKVTLNNDGTVTVTPDPGFTGEIKFPYEVTTPTGTKVSATDTVLIVGAKDDFKETAINTPVKLNILTNDSVPSGSKITSINGQPITTGQTVTVPNGTVTLNSDGTITVTPNNGYLGEIKFPYEITTPLGSKVSANVTVPVLGLKDDSKETAVNTPTTYNPLLNDSVPTGSKITSINGQPITVGQTVNVLNGTVTLNSDGTLTVIPNPGYTGEIKFPYEVTTPNGTKVTANDTITIVKAVDDIKTTPINQPITYNPLENDIVPPNSKITSINGLPIAPGQTVNVPNAKVTLNNDGTLTVTPDQGYTGEIKFPYEVTTPSGTKVTANDTIKITGMISKLDIYKKGTFIDSNSNGYAEVGEEIKYNFNVKNIGNTDVTNVVVTDNKCTVIGGPIAKMIPTAQDNTTFTCTYKLTQADITLGKVENQAIVSGKGPNGETIKELSDPEGSLDGTKDVPTIVNIKGKLKVPDFDLTKTGKFNDLNNDGFSQPGETIKYSFIIKNTGNTQLTDIVIQDSKCSPILLSPIPKLNIGESNSQAYCIYSITQQDIDSGKHENKATATAKDEDGISVIRESHNENGQKITTVMLNKKVVQLVERILTRTGGAMPILSFASIVTLLSILVYVLKRKKVK